LNHCANNTPLDLAKIQQKSRQYAKRQITWINHQFKDRLIYNQNNFNEIVESFQTKQ
jgi:tRNA A37 N6-isopentenylltransferase MiaA